VVTLAERQLVGIEAALCWIHPQRGLLAHERCIAAAERTGAVHTISEWLLRTAAEQALVWRQRVAGDPVPVMINLTPSQARDPELIATVTAVLAETGVAPQVLELRAPVAAIRAVTGEFAGEGGAQAEDNLRVLTQLGVRAGIHDFAGGIGGLRCRAELPLSSVRIAPLITQQVAGGPCPIQAPAMRTSIQSFRAASINVLAYPVDTVLEAAYCTDLGVNWALGALYGPPGPPEHIHPLLRGPRPRV
jgi:EAL domain-containing protein (putative c-di-GMP-specific phosphodiesterase class I)